MEDKADTITWKIFGFYILIIVLMLTSNLAFSQISVAQFNADWNKSNSVKWIDKLKDVKTLSYVDISTSPAIQKKHKIAVIPTIIIFKDGEEVARFQADLSFKMLATREEVQEEIDNQLMSDF
jgi:thiol-disulfide isomerase/thioredoxin